MKIDLDFFQRSNVKSIARDLLGKVLITNIDRKTTSGIIVETEAYSYKERGCHAYNKLRTRRTEVMFKRGGHTYVYLCYGIHQMFNIVTNKEGTPEAVLVRALQPVAGLDMMLKRMKSEKEKRITSGPGKLTKALAINRKLNGVLLTGNKIWLEDDGMKIASHQLIATKRVGIDYAGSDADLPWRFYIKHNEWVSRH